MLQNVEIIDLDWTRLSGRASRCSVVCSPSEPLPASSLLVSSDHPREASSLPAFPLWAAHRALPLLALLSSDRKACSLSPPWLLALPLSPDSLPLGPSSSRPVSPIWVGCRHAEPPTVAREPPRSSLSGDERLVPVGLHAPRSHPRRCHVPRALTILPLLVGQLEPTSPHLGRLVPGLAGSPAATNVLSKAQCDNAPR